MTGPFVGLDYFDEEDAPLFFGRDAERTRLIGNLRASRLTLLYAQSGVGKSSLLRAGVAARLRQIAVRDERRRSAARYVPIVFSTWHGDPVPELIERVEDALRPFVPDGETLSLPRDDLEAALQEGVERTGAMPLVMLDQFEEYFLYHPDVADGGFADELVRCVMRTDLRANFLISIREDAYSRIGDRFGARIPNVFANYLQLEHLDQTSAREAIVRPIEHSNATAFNGDAPLQIEPELVEEVLEQVRRVGGDAIDAPRYEAPYLQLVLERLWKHDAASGTLKVETLKELGGAGTIVRAHLEDAMRKLGDEERAAGAAAFRFLVTSSGSKIALTAGGLASSRAPRAALDSALERLDHARVLRRAASAGDESRYELFHDVLGQAVIEWRKRYEAEAEAEAFARELEAEEQRHLEVEHARHTAQLNRVVRIGTCILGVLVVGLVVAVLVALNERSVARSHALAGASVAGIDNDPELSLVLAQEAWAADHNAPAEEAMRLAVSSSRALGRLPSLDTGHHYAFGDHGGRYVGVVAGDTARIWDGRSRRWLRDAPLKPGGPITAIDWSQDDSTLAISARDGVIVDRLGETPRRVTYGDSAYLDLNDDGTMLVAAVGKTATVYDTRSGSVLATLPHPHTVTQAEFIGGSDGTVASSTCADGNLRLWDWRKATARILRLAGERTTHQRPANTTAGCVFSASADGAMLATAFTSQNVRLWSVPKQRFLRELTGESTVYDVRFGPRGHSLVVADPDGARVYSDAEDYSLPLAVSREMTSIDGGGLIVGDHLVTAFAYSDDGTRIAIGTGDGTIAVDDAETGQTQFVLRGHADTINSLDFMAGDRLVSGGDDGSVRLWDVRTPPNLLGQDAPGVVGVSYSKDGRSLAFAGSDGNVHLVASGGGQPRSVPTGMSFVSGAQYTADGNVLVAASNPWEQGGALILVDPKTATVERRFSMPGPGEISAAVMIPHDGRIVSFGQVPTIYDPAREKLTKLRWPRDVTARGVGVSADGRSIALAGDDGQVRIFDNRTLRRTASFGKRNEAPSGVIFSPDAKRVLTFGGDRLAHLWDIASRRKVATMRGHEGGVMTAAFSRDGTFVATGATDNSVRVWNAETGRAMGVDRTHSGAVTAVAFDPRDNRSIASSANDSSVTVFRCESCGAMGDVEDAVRKATRSRSLTQAERQEFLGG